MQEQEIKIRVKKKSLIVFIYFLNKLSSNISVVDEKIFILLVRVILTTKFIQI